MKRGIDISRYQTVTSWPAVTAAYDFGVFKASEGTAPHVGFDVNARAAREQAWQWGAFHFLRPDVKTVPAQLDAFKRQLTASQYGDANIIPALDVEDEGAVIGVPFTPEHYRDATTVFIEGMLAEWGRAIVYTSQFSWHSIGNPEILLDTRVFLWVAHYTSKPSPACPMSKPYTIWQWGQLPVTGITSPGGVDQNRCPGPLPLLVGPEPEQFPPGIESPLLDAEPFPLEDK